MTKCKICNLDTKGRGQYSFSYLGETVYLCGHHAQKVWLFIEARALVEGGKHG